MSLYALLTGDTAAVRCPVRVWGHSGESFSSRHWTRACGTSSRYGYSWPVFLLPSWWHHFIWTACLCVKGHLSVLTCAIAALTLEGSYEELRILSRSYLLHLRMTERNAFWKSGKPCYPTSLNVPSPLAPGAANLVSASPAVWSQLPVWFLWPHLTPCRGQNDELVAI